MRRHEKKIPLQSNESDDGTEFCSVCRHCTKIDGIARRSTSHFLNVNPC